MNPQAVFVDKRTKVNSRGDDKSQVPSEAGTSPLVTHLLRKGGEGLAGPQL